MPWLAVLIDAAVRRKLPVRHRPRIVRRVRQIWKLGVCYRGVSAVPLQLKIRLRGSVEQ